MQTEANVNMYHATSVIIQPFTHQLSLSLISLSRASVIKKSALNVLIYEHVHINKRKQNSVRSYQALTIADLFYLFGGHQMVVGAGFDDDFVAHFRLEFLLQCPGCPHPDL